MHKAMTATAQPSATDVYALGRDPGETERLQRQSEELGPDSAALLDRAGLRPGQDAIDLGCGPRGILDLLAERVKDSARARRRAGRGPGPRRHGQEVHRATRTRQRGHPLAACTRGAPACHQDHSTWCTPAPCW